MAFSRVEASVNAFEAQASFSGTLEHPIDDEIFRLEPGDPIRVSAGRSTTPATVSDDPVEMIVCYSPPTRAIILHEEA